MEIAGTDEGWGTLPLTDGGCKRLIFISTPLTTGNLILCGITHPGLLSPLGIFTTHQTTAPNVRAVGAVIEAALSPRPDRSSHLAALASI